MTNEVMLCLVRKLARVGKVAVLLHSQRFNGTYPVAVQSHVSRLHVIAVARVEVVETTGAEERC